MTIEGNIGSGKTSLATKIAAQYDAKLILEQFADNPFLPSFYADQEKYAFPLELFFMAERYQQLKSNISGRELFQEMIVTDYMFTKSLIFAKVTLQEEEFKLYNRLFSIINPTLPEPDLTVYLYCSINRLISNIKKRGRTYEQQIPKEYLQRLHETYMDYFRQRTHLKVLIIDVSDIYFLEEEDQYKRIIQIIDQDYAPGIHLAD